ncbi:hypothetical protein [Bradyrhizobium ottawaense]|uniref:hypothetical protein n=1 Tax=Bradyrhizobium ottawaense TaxID=931866 RepID=UPI00156172D4|nr:hypothetical protein [Bradyrhizobium ottawaense]
MKCAERGETGSHQKNEPAQPEQSRRPEQGKQRDWISEKTKSERIYVRPERPAAVIDTQNVVCMMDESYKDHRAYDDCGTLA